MQWPRYSYAQMGEDLIIENNLGRYNLKSSNLYYLEIGTHHPSHSNNTYLFYKNGSRGVLVEPDVNCWERIEQERPDDKLIKAGAGDYSISQAEYYVLTARTLNTFVKSMAEANCQAVDRYGNQKIEEVKTLPLIEVNELIEKHCDRCPDLISIDTEGFDLDILKSIKFEKYNISIVCVEINEQRKEMVDWMSTQDYVILGDNNLNLIFGKRYE